MQPRSEPHRVLLLLDAQAALLAAPPTGVPSAPTVLANLTRMLAAARAATPPPLIIHVRNSGDAGEPDAPGTPGHALVLAPAPGEHVLDKAKNNAFAGTPLGALVPARAELVVAGLLSDYAVAATCRAAVARGNEVILVHGAHAAYDRPEALYGGGVLEAGRLEAQVESELEEIGVSVFEMEDLEAIFTDR
ncbi:Isochorismatase-like protein [Schizophyllum amplum]|uniref:Isochorismatase-like protein n=1 Tax=Schizophyllum amplum TaxID=97359 RepID=A0A550BWY5_9AGAR|nr:Isochorismatase-like protein [Auriculariopsis ampla]